MSAAERLHYEADRMRSFMAQDQSRLAWFFYRCGVSRAAVEAEPGSVLFRCTRDRGMTVDELDTFSTASDSESVDDWFPHTEGVVDS